MKKIPNKVMFLICLLVMLILSPSCKKFIEVDVPVTNTTETNVYSTDKTAAAVLTEVYANLSDRANNLDFDGASLPGITLRAGLLSDELALYNINNQTLVAYYGNLLTSVQTDHLWNDIYPIVFVCNSAIEGLNESESLSSSVRQQLLGEAKFMRAFCYFYLVNFYGAVPLAITTDYKVNALLSRTKESEVYQQIVADLKDAQNLLGTEYLDGYVTSTTTERVRPNKAAAAAMLARVYLFTGRWAEAELQASLVIGDMDRYDMVSLGEVFQKNSKETIWALQPVGMNENQNTGDGKLFVLPDSGPDNFQYPVYLSEDVVASFETNDGRKTEWISSKSIGIAEYSYPNKYKVGRVNTSTSEYTVVLRLAEQYLIRAEARAQLGNISGSQDDLNVIRTRANLNSTNASSGASLVEAILQERRVELFVEWGHRWIDLKRTGTLDNIMTNVLPKKNGMTWNSYKGLLPIPQSDISRNISLQGHQNPQY